MLAPLHVHQSGAPIAPIGMEDLSVPKHPEVSGRAGGVVTDPDDLLIGWDSEWDPGSVHVVPPEQMIRDYASGRMHDGNNSLERKPFVALQEQHGGERPREVRRRVISRDPPGDGARLGVLKGNLGPWAAPNDHQGRTDEHVTHLLVTPQHGKGHGITTFGGYFGEPQKSYR